MAKTHPDRTPTDLRPRWRWCENTSLVEAAGPIRLLAKPSV